MITVKKYSNAIQGIIYNGCHGNGHGKAKLEEFLPHLRMKSVLNVCVWDFTIYFFSTLMHRIVVNNFQCNIGHRL